MDPMDDIMGTREVVAPKEGYDWLTEAQVLHILGIESRTLYDYIAERRIPEPVRFGNVRKWWWEGIAYFWLGQKLTGMLRPPGKLPAPAVDDDTDVPDRPAAVRGSSRRSAADGGGSRSSADS